MTRIQAVAITAALNSLGDSSSQIAGSLCQQGFKGQLELCDCCPLANYLAAKFPDNQFKVHAGGIEVDQDGFISTTTIMDFVEDFDSRKYPELVADPLSEAKTRKSHG